MCVCVCVARVCAFMRERGARVSRVGEEEEGGKGRGGRGRGGGGGEEEGRKECANVRT